MNDTPEVQVPELRGACPAFGCAAIVIREASLGAGYVAHCVRCGWLGQLDEDGKPICS